MSSNNVHTVIVNLSNRVVMSKLGEGERKIIEGVVALSRLGNETLLLEIPEGGPQVEVNGAVASELLQLKLGESFVMSGQKYAVLAQGRPFFVEQEPLGEQRSLRISKLLAQSKSIKKIDSARLRVNARKEITWKKPLAVRLYVGAICALSAAVALLLLGRSEQREGGEPKREGMMAVAEASLVTPVAAATAVATVATAAAAATAKVSLIGTPVPAAVTNKVAAVKGATQTRSDNEGGGAYSLRKILMGNIAEAQTSINKLKGESKATLGQLLVTARAVDRQGVSDLHQAKNILESLVKAQKIIGKKEFGWLAPAASKLSVYVGGLVGSVLGNANSLTPEVLQIMTKSRFLLNSEQQKMLDDLTANLTMEINKALVLRDFDPAESRRLLLSVKSRVGREQPWATRVAQALSKSANSRITN